MSSEEKLPLQNMEDIPPVSYASVSMPDNDDDGLNGMVEKDDNTEYSTQRPFGEKFTTEFWSKVNAYFEPGNGIQGLEWQDAMFRARADAIQEKAFQSSQDPIVLLADFHDKFLLNQQKEDHYPTFVNELSQLATLILRDDHIAAKKYNDPLKIPNESGDEELKTVLYLAAERNLTALAKLVSSLYPGTLYTDNHVYLTKDDGKVKKHQIIPLEIALRNRNAEVACFLMDTMVNEKVRDLFENKKGKMAKFKLRDFIADEEMKPVALHMLDCLITDDWPYTPVDKNESKPEAHSWSRMPNTPQRYHVFYQILDGDGEGRDPHHKKFDHKNPSALQVIANTTHCQKDAAIHPAVRLLVARKWKNYGDLWTKIYFGVYLTFLLSMSLAFLTRDFNRDPRKYQFTLDYIRGVFEVLTLLFALWYMGTEIDQLVKERWMYFKDYYNALDVFGIALIFALVPLRYTNKDQAESAVAACAFFINFVRIFKFMPAFKTMSVYSKTFAQIFYDDIPKFLGVYLIVFGAFVGSVYLSLQASKDISKVGSFSTVVLNQVRALAESNGFADDYGQFNAGVTVFLMINMMSIIVVMANILIGQISYRYTLAQNQARIQNHVDRTKWVTRIESSSFKSRDKRLKFYIPGEFVEESVIRSLRKAWETAKEEASEPDL